MFEDLLPAPDTAPRCALFTAGLGVDPVGTAIRADQLFLVEIPRPWPSPIRDHPLLVGMMDVVGGLNIPSRLWAAVPNGQNPRVIRLRRRAGGADRTAFPRSSDLASQLTAIGSGSEEGALARPSPNASVLICTQGSHDVCCGSEGARLAERVGGRFPGVEVHQVSHTGGHRFAPTGMTFPDGRMWSYLDEEVLRQILDRSGDPGRLAPRCRGWWGAERGTAQAAERAVFAAEGWSWAERERTVLLVRSDGAATIHRVVSEARTWIVEVVVRREVPTISCRATGGLPAKPAQEYAARVVSVEGAE
jgi:hypothetical protein